MNTLMKVPVLVSVLAWPLAVLSQSNEAFVEKSKIFGGGNVIHLYGLPAKDSTGKIKYWDTTITLEIGSNGKPTGNSATVSVAQAKPKSTEFVPGVYSDANGEYTCTLQNSAIIGRTQFDLLCTRSSSHVYTGTWYTGPISGHPWEAALVAAQLDTLPDHAEYSWGRTMYVLYNDELGCFDVGELFSARQAGSNLSLVNYGANKTIDCQFTLVKQP